MNVAQVSCLIAQAFSGQLVDNLYLMVSRLDGLTSWFCRFAMNLQRIKEPIFLVVWDTLPEAL